MLSIEKRLFIKIARLNIKKKKETNIKKLNKKRKLLTQALIATILIALTLFASNANAACFCTCVNGHNRPVCNNNLEIAPICPPTVCPINGGYNIR